MDKSFQDSDETLSHRETPDSQSGLEELRNLIVGTTDQRVEQIQQRLADPEERADDISRVLPKAVSLSASRNDNLAVALQPLTERAIRDSIKKDRRILVDVLFPVMGPAIRKAIAATIQGLIQNFNQILEHSLSIKGLRWRIEALRTRRPFAEVVLLHTLVYQVEQVFLVHRESGLLIDHVVAKTAVAQNPDMVSGMLSAIKDFVQDSFGANQDETLDTFQVGQRKVWIEHGPHAILALVISGNPSLHLKDMMRDILDEVHVNTSQSLKSFDGDPTPFKEITPVLNGLLQVQFKSQSPKKYGAWIIIGILCLLVGWSIFHWTVRVRHWSGFVDALNRQPGIVVTQVKTWDGKRHVYGLKDPFAPEVTQLLASAEMSSESVVFHWEPFQSAHPEYVQQRVTKLFSPPATVLLVYQTGRLSATGAALDQWIQDTRRLARLVPWIDHYDDGDLMNINERLNTPETVSLTLVKKTLYASGSASGAWMAKTRSVVPSLPNITSYNDERLANADQLEWVSLTRAIESSVFYFQSGRNALMAGQQRKLQHFIETVRQFLALSELLDRPVQIDIQGHADQTGDDAGNMAVSRQRARTFMNLLAAADMNKVFTVHAVGSHDPVKPEIDEKNRAFNRRVTFMVRPLLP